MKRIIDFLQQIFLAGGGRPVALLILVVLTTLSLLSEAPHLPADTGTWSERQLGALTQPFRGGREFLFDRYQQLSPRIRSAQPVTIVEIDEDSLKRIGQWPWPRNRLAELVDAINFLQPAAIGLDMYMPEPDATSPAQVASAVNGIGVADAAGANAARPTRMVVAAVAYRARRPVNMRMAGAFRGVWGERGVRRRCRGRGAPHARPRGACRWRRL